MIQQPLFFKTCILLLMFETARGQEEVEEELVPASNTSMNTVYWMFLYSFVGSCASLLLFFCLKIYLEYRIRNRPVVEYGAFGDLRDICLEDLTPEQRKAIVDVVFSDGNSTLFEENDDKEKEMKETSVNRSPTSIMCVFHDEESPAEGRQSSLQQMPDLNFSQSEELSMNENHKFLKLPPTLKRKPMFFPLATHDDSDKFDTNANGNTKTIECEKTESNDCCALEVIDDNANDKECSDELSDCDVEAGVCSICIDAYEPGDEIIKSPHCPHYFHKECVMQWLEKSFCCPVCRKDMISEDEVVGAIGIIILQYSGEKKSASEIRTQINDKSSKRTGGVNNPGSLQRLPIPNGNTN